MSGRGRADAATAITDRSPRTRLDASLGAELRRRSSGAGFWLVVGTVAAVLVGGLAYALIRIHDDERTQLERQFVSRTEFAARTTGGLVGSSISQIATTAAQQLGGTRSQLAAQLKAYIQGSPPNEPSIVFSARGSVLQQVAPRLPTAALETLRSAVTAAGTGNKGALSDAFEGSAATPMFAVIVPYNSRYGRRVLVNAGPLDTIKAIAQGYLASGPAVAGGDAYLVDGHGNVLVDGDGAVGGGPLRDRALLRATMSKSQGAIGGLHYAVAGVGNGGDWKIIFTAPDRELFAPVSGSFTTAWVLFGVLVMAVFAALALGARAIRRSAALARNAVTLAQAEERARAAEELAHERLHDALTGLPNRNLFLDRIELALGAQQAERAPVAVLVLDVDRFKRVNDSLGHDLGDRLLRTIARRLTDVLGPTDTLSRPGGDEFMVLRPAIRDAREAMILAGQLGAAIEAPVDLDGRRVRVTATIGVAVHEADGPAVEAVELVRKADVAMHRAKSIPGARAHVFDTALQHTVAEQLDTEIALSAAVANDELLLHYQPIVGLPGGEMHGAEVLVRWQRPGVGMVQPLDFIPIAEESGLIVEIGAWVLAQASKDVARWRQEGLVDRQFVLSVNVSPRQLAASGLRATVAQVLRDAPMAPQTLCLEVTESAIMADETAAIEALDGLKEIGVTVAMDDFGTGQTSLGRIKKLPIDEVKLDRSFVSGADGFDNAIVPTIALLARSLKLTAVAEGVETAGDAEQCAAFGFRLAQGFHFGRPESQAAFRARLRRRAEARVEVSPAG